MIHIIIGLGIVAAVLWFTVGARRVVFCRHLVTSR